MKTAQIPGFSGHDGVCLARPNELRMSQANPAKAHARLGWKAAHSMPDVVRLMLEHEGKGGDD